MQKHKSTKVRASDGRALVLGLVSAVVTMVIMLITSVICITNEYFTLDAFEIVSLFIQFICVFVGCFIAGALVKENRERMVLLVTSILYLLQLCSAILFFDGIENTFWVNLLIAVLATIANILILRQQKSKSKGRTIMRRR